MQVWRVLTDYDRLVEFVPNLEVCEKLLGGTATRYRLRQKGCSQSLYIRLEASAVLDVQEVSGVMGRRELRFTMIESQNFKVRVLWDSLSQRSPVHLQTWEGYVRFALLS